MKGFNKIIIFVVGGLFIFSGLIKLNDPVGTQIKLEEYFEVFAADFEESEDRINENHGEFENTSIASRFFKALIPFSLSLAVILSVLEVVLGINLLIGYRASFTLWVLMILILFFTFLTFYSAYYNKVTDCGCFGDAIPLSPWQSFYKDIILLIMIAYLWTVHHFTQFKIKAIFKAKVSFAINLFGTLAAFALAWYAIMNLPPIDFRSYKVGVNIRTAMEASEPIRYKNTYTFINKKDGKEYQFDEWQNDTLLYQYQSYQQEVLNPEALPKITDFIIQDEVITQNVLNGNKLIFILHHANTANENGVKKMSELIRQSHSQDLINPILLTATDKASFEIFRHEYQLAAPFYLTDQTLLKTMIRSNPGVILLKDGLILGKWHHRNMPHLSTLKNLIGS